VRRGPAADVQRFRSWYVSLADALVDRTATPPPHPRDDDDGRTVVPCVRQALAAEAIPLSTPLSACCGHATSSTPSSSSESACSSAPPSFQARPGREPQTDRSIRNTRPVSQPLRTGSREVLRVVRGATPTHDHLRARLVIIAVATVVLDAVASVIVFLFERDAAGTGITSLGDSVFWTSTQLLTVSSQLPNPISTPARALDIFLQAYAITVVAMLAGSFGAFFHRRGIERDPL
jgi:hypothetical protein